jgi:hypothetical protein
MMRSPTVSLLPLITMAAFAAGCGGDSRSPVDPSAPGSGTVSFTYSGTAVSGSFNATGALQSSGANQPQFGTFAVGWREGSEFGIYGFRAASNNRGDAFYIDGRPITGPGTFPVREWCDSPSQPCVEIYFDRNIHWTTGALDNECYLTSGSLTVTSLSNSQAQGTFSGQGECFSSTGQLQGSFAIANGSFNVPVITDFNP